MNRITNYELRITRVPRYASLVTILLFIVLFTSGLHAQDKTVIYLFDAASLPSEKMVDLQHLEAHVAFKPETNTVIASATFTFEAIRVKTDSLVFSTPGFIFTSVTMDSKPAKYKVSGDIVTVYPPNHLERYKTYNISFEYTASPQAGSIYFIGWKDFEKGKRRQIWAHRPNGWLPYMDDRITVDMFITFDDDYKVFSNGERLEVKKNRDHTLTWHYAMKNNHPFFSTALVIGDDGYKETHSARGVPIELWYYTGMEDRVSTTYKYMERMVDFFELEMGLNYPWPVYRQAPLIDYMYGGMETTTSTVFGDYMLIDPRAWWQRNYVNVNAHELAHQWFGNYISHLTHKDVWLTESFGTYYAKIFEKSVFGNDYYENLRNDELAQALTASQSNNYPVGSSMGGVARIYQKGSLVLDMLRDVLGEEEFKSVVKYYLEKHAYDNAETNDFIRAVQLNTGKNLNWFFDEWILRGGEPNYKVSYSSSDKIDGSRITSVNVEQIQEVNEMRGLFKMPIRFEVHYKDGSFDSTAKMVEKQFHEIVIPNKGKKEIDFVLFDPGRRVVKKVTFDKGFEELSAQSLRASNILDRYDAMTALRETPVEKKRELLIHCFGQESFHLTKSEIISQLANDTSKTATVFLQRAVNDPDANVRKAVLKNLHIIPAELIPDFEKLLNDSSYLNVELALDLLYKSNPKEIGKYLELTKNDLGWRGLNIRMKWLEIAIPLGHREDLAELVDYSSPKFEFETRINALNVMRNLNYLNGDGIQNLFSACTHWNNKLYNAARPVLTFFYQQGQFKTKIREAFDKGTWTDKERTILSGIITQ